MKEIFSTVFAFVLVILLGSCSDGPQKGMIWDFVNYDVSFEMTDADGNDLLDPANPANILGNPVTVTFQGKKYTAESDTRAIAPRSWALRHGMSEKSGRYTLNFGEFSPEASYKGEKFTIDWGNGNSDEVSLDLFITWKRHNPTVHKALYLNGQKQADDKFLVPVFK